MDREKNEIEAFGLRKFDVLCQLEVDPESITAKVATAHRDSFEIWKEQYDLCYFASKKNETELPHGAFFMLVALQVVSVLLVAIAMSLAVAHALEFPGKRRLDRQTYLAVQTIYYPGFTLAGTGEPLAAIATLILLVTMRNQGAAYWWVLVSFIALLAMHAVFWLVTQPTNRYWLRRQQLGEAGARFFGINRSEAARRDREEEGESADWKALRNRWEYSHIIRSILSLIALVTLTVAIAR